LGQELKILVSDVVVATEWPIAAEALERLGYGMPMQEDDDQLAGEADIFADLGFSAMEMAALCDDLGLYPDEQIEAIAHRLGFGPEFESLMDFSNQ
jgi:putative tRNA adenosine deaminase-associated protein